MRAKREKDLIKETFGKKQEMPEDVPVPNPVILSGVNSESPSEPVDIQPSIEHAPTIVTADTEKVSINLHIYPLVAGRVFFI